MVRARDVAAALAAAGAVGVAAYAVYRSLPRRAATIRVEVRVAPRGGGDTAPPPGVHEYVKGSQVVLVATPRRGYRFDRWIVDGDVGDNPVYTMIASRDVTATAIFTPEAVEEPGEGEPGAGEPRGKPGITGITLTADRVEVEEGGDVTFTIQVRVDWTPDVTVGYSLEMLVSGVKVAAVSVAVNPGSTSAIARYRLKFMEPGMHAVVVRDPDTRVESNVVTVAVRRREPPGAGRGSVWGIVRDADTGVYVRGAVISYDGASAEVDPLTGRYSIEVEPGRVTLTASAPNYVSQTKSVVVEAGEEVRVDFWLTPERPVRPPPQPPPSPVPEPDPGMSMLHGFVVYAMGGAVAGAQVSADGYSTVTNWDGYYVLYLPPGAYTVTVRREGITPVEKLVELAPGEVKRLDITVAPLYAG